MELEWAQWAPSKLIGPWATNNEQINKNHKTAIFSDVRAFLVLNEQGVANFITFYCHVFLFLAKTKWKDIFYFV